MMNNFPNRFDGINFYLPILQIDNEITYNDFKNFIEK